MKRLAQTFGWADFPRPLFYESPFALRFDLGGDHETGPTRFLQAMDRARAIAALTFADTDTLTVAISYIAHDADSSVLAKLRRALSSFGVSGSIGLPVRMDARDKDDFEDEADGYHRFLCTLDTANDPEQLALFIWASVAKEMPIRPRISSRQFSKLDIFVTDLTLGIVLHIYDDRGMDLIALHPRVLLPCYDRFNGWLLDHDRARMDATFASGSKKGS